MTARRPETDVSIRLWRREAAVNAGGVRQAEVTALVFRDETADGSRQAAEPGMQDVQVTLLREDGSRLTEAASAVTDETARFVLTGVRPGTICWKLKRLRKIGRLPRRRRNARRRWRYKAAPRWTRVSSA